MHGKGEIKFTMQAKYWREKIKEKIVLRPWTNEDLPSLLKYANNPLIAANMMDTFPHPYTQETGKYFIAMAKKDAPPRLLAIDINGEACGGIGIHPQSDIKRLNAEMGYWLAEQWWGRGIITEAIKRMVVYTFNNFELTRIYACPFGTNIGSQKALEKAGFVLEGRFEKVYIKNNQLVDELIYAVRKDYKPNSD